MCDQDTVQKVLECSVCLRPFTDPRLLPCGHTLCTECMTRMVRNSRIVCPECRRRHKVPQDGVEHFPPNPVVISLLDTLCKNCKKNKPQTDCSHCGQRLCNCCVATHSNLQEIETVLRDLRKTIDQARDVVRVEPLKDNISLLQEIDFLSILMHQTINDEIQALKNSALERIHADVKQFVDWSLSVFSKLQAAQQFHERTQYTFVNSDTEYVDDKQLEDVKTQNNGFERDIQEIISQMPLVTKLCLKFSALDIKRFFSIEEASSEVDQSTRNQEPDIGAGQLQETENPEPCQETSESSQQTNADQKEVATPCYLDNIDVAGYPVCGSCRRPKLTRASSPPVSIKVYLITDDVFAEHRGLDLFDPQYVELSGNLQVNGKMTFCELIPLASKELRLTPEQIRIWPFAVRYNCAFRPAVFNNKSKTNIGELTVNEDELYIFVECTRSLPKLPRFDPERDVLLFLKKYDPLTECISYCGHVYMPASARILTYLMPIMRQRGGFPPEMSLLVFEEVSYKSVVKLPETRLRMPLLQAFDKLQDGDILIFQMNEQLSNYRLPTIRHYLK